MHSSRRKGYAHTNNKWVKTHDFKKDFKETYTNYTISHEGLVEYIEVQRNIDKQTKISIKFRSDWSTESFLQRYKSKLNQHHLPLPIDASGISIYLTLERSFEELGDTIALLNIIHEFDPFPGEWLETLKAALMINPYHGWDVDGNLEANDSRFPNLKRCETYTNNNANQKIQWFSVTIPTNGQQKMTVQVRFSDVTETEKFIASHDYKARPFPMPPQDQQGSCLALSMHRDANDVEELSQFLDLMHRFDSFPEIWLFRIKKLLNAPLATKIQVEQKIMALYARQRNTDEALEVARKHESFSDSYTGLIYSLGKTCQKNGNYPQAHHVYSFVDHITYERRVSDPFLEDMIETFQNNQVEIAEQERQHLYNNVKIAAFAKQIATLENAIKPQLSPTKKIANTTSAAKSALTEQKDDETIQLNQSYNTLNIRIAINAILEIYDSGNFPEAFKQAKQLEEVNGNNYYSHRYLRELGMACEKKNDLRNANEAYMAMETKLREREKVRFRHRLARKITDQQATLATINASIREQRRIISEQERSLEILERNARILQVVIKKSEEKGVKSECSERFFQPHSKNLTLPPINTKQASTNSLRK